MTPEEKAAADKKAADEKKAADDAAAAQREADKKAIDDAAKAKPTQTAFHFSGTVGGVFGVYGHGFGTSGTLTIGGVNVTPTSWSNTRIKGTVPSDVKSGKTTVVVNGKSIDATV